MRTLRSFLRKGCKDEGKGGGNRRYRVYSLRQARNPRGCKVRRKKSVGTVSWEKELLVIRICAIYSFQFGGAERGRTGGAQSRPA